MENVKGINMKEKFEYYVVVRRFLQLLDENAKEAKIIIELMQRQEAISKNWIDQNGDRIWVVPPREEKNLTTSVFGFKSLESAINFYNTFLENGVGILAEEL